MLIKIVLMRLNPSLIDAIKVISVVIVFFNYLNDIRNLTGPNLFYIAHSTVHHVDHLVVHHATHPTIQHVGHSTVQHVL